MAQPDLNQSSSGHEYGATTIADRATAMLGDRVNYGDRFTINNATFVLADAPDPRTLALRAVSSLSATTSRTPPVTEKNTGARLYTGVLSQHPSSTNGSLLEQLQEAERRAEEAEARVDILEHECYNVKLDNEKVKLRLTEATTKLQVAEERAKKARAGARKLAINYHQVIEDREEAASQATEAAKQLLMVEQKAGAGEIKARELDEKYQDLLAVSGLAVKAIKQFQDSIRAALSWFQPAMKYYTDLPLNGSNQRPVSLGHACARDLQSALEGLEAYLLPVRYSSHFEQARSAETQVRARDHSVFNGVHFDTGSHVVDAKGRAMRRVVIVDSSGKAMGDSRDVPPKPVVPDSENMLWAVAWHSEARRWFYINRRTCECTWEKPRWQVQQSPKPGRRSLFHEHDLRVM